jgi:hypothetical protein
MHDTCKPMNVRRRLLPAPAALVAVMRLQQLLSLLRQVRSCCLQRPRAALPIPAPQDSQGRKVPWGNMPYEWLFGEKGWCEAERPDHL